jgi:DNA-binding MarR family transcriptional regulator
MNKNQSLPWDHPRFKSWVSVARACQLMQATLTRELAPLDIKPPHLDILANLYRFEGLSQQELARKLLVGRSNISMTLPQMERRGLIERRGDSRDKRVLRLYLTADGRQLAERAMQIQTAVIERSLSVNSLEQCLGTAEAMERIILALQVENDDS